MEQKPQFSPGHLGVIALAAAILILFSMVQHGFHFGRASAENQAEQESDLTYDQVRDEVAAAHAKQNQPETDEVLGDQLALIDPSLNQAAVLGASTDLSNAIPDAEQLFSKSRLDQIQLKLNFKTSPEVLQSYATSLNFLENAYSSVSLIASLNSADPDTLREAESKSKKFLSELAHMEVPQVFADYHKLKLLYYSLLGQAAGGYLQSQDSPEASTAALGLFSLTDKLEQMRNKLNAKYQTEL